jgi:hypothetical protein
MGYRFSDPLALKMKAFWNVGKYSTNNKASHPRTVEPSATPLWEPKISQKIVVFWHVT